MIIDSAAASLPLMFSSSGESDHAVDMLPFSSLRLDTVKLFPDVLPSTPAYINSCSSFPVTSSNVTSNRPSMMSATFSGYVTDVSSPMNLTVICEISPAFIVISPLSVYGVSVSSGITVGM